MTFSYSSSSLTLSLPVFQVIASPVPFIKFSRKNTFIRVSTPLDGVTRGGPPPPPSDDPLPQ